METGPAALLPPLVTLLLAFATRRVVLSLLLGVATGGVVLFLRSHDPRDLDPITRFFIPALASRSFALILVVYFLGLGGMMGLWQRTGAISVLAASLARRLVRGPRSALVFAWSAGIVIHQGGTVSAALAGFCARPVTDAHRVSHEELSFVVDATASPVVTVIPLNAWPLLVAALITGTVPALSDDSSAVALFFQAIPWNVYSIAMVAVALLVARGWMPWTGARLAAARTRARHEGRLDGDDAAPFDASVDARLGVIEPGYQAGAAEILVPLALLFGTAVVSYAYGGSPRLEIAFPLALAALTITARAKGMRTRGIAAAFVAGCRRMIPGIVVLALAVTLGDVTTRVGTGAFVVAAIGDGVPAPLLPALLLLASSALAFATGTSLGTLAVVLPSLLPLVAATSPDATYLCVAFGAMLGGAIFGDQCSPVSDTTILSSLFSGCDLMDHVRSQLPLGLLCLAIAGLVATAAALSVG